MPTAAEPPSPSARPTPIPADEAEHDAPNGNGPAPDTAPAATASDDPPEHGNTETGGATGTSESGTEPEADTTAAGTGSEGGTQPDVGAAAAGTTDEPGEVRRDDPTGQDSSRTGTTKAAGASGDPSEPGARETGGATGASEGRTEPEPDVTAAGTTSEGGAEPGVDAEGEIGEGRRGTGGAGASGDAGDLVQVARLDWRSAVWIAGGLFVALVLVGLVKNIPDSLTRVGVGILFAFALDPIVVRLRNRLGCSRSTAVAIVSLAVGALFALLVFILGPPAVDQAQRFGRELPETVESAYDFPVVGPWLKHRDAADEVRNWASDLPARVDTDSVTEVARSILDGVLAALIVMVVGLAVLIDGDRLVGRLHAALPKGIEPAAVRVGRTFYRTMGAYFAGSLLVASLAAIFILAVGLAFQVPLAPAAALWMLVVNLIPQVGGFLGGGFFVLLALTQGLGTGVICLILYIVYQNLENHLIQPTIVGQAVDLSPPATMLAALVGGAAAGIPGALVATPLAGAAKTLYMEIRWGRTPQPHRALRRLLHH